MTRPNPKCPSCGKRGQRFQWRGPGGIPIHIECPHCDWAWRALPPELVDGTAPWNTHGHPQARLAASWAALKPREVTNA